MPHGGWATSIAAASLCCRLLSLAAAEGELETV